MEAYFHSVRLNDSRCKGCVNCTKRCPTEAIRIRGGKAHITESRCIDCGECIRRCPNHAKSAVTDELTALTNYKYNIALPAPSLYAQFSSETPVDAILNALLSLGFDEVFEVAVGAEIVTMAIKDYLKNEKITKPVISSACPAVVRMIQVQFPELIPQLIPIDSPVEVAARIARQQCIRKYNIENKEIGVWFITPCPAKMTSIKQPLGAEKSHITGAIGISQIYGDILKALSGAPGLKKDKTASWRGVGWALAGGETQEESNKDTLVVHEIHNVKEVLEQIALGKMKGVRYVEASACAGGCIGGPLTVENRFVAEHYMKQRLEKMQSEMPDKREQNIWIQKLYEEYKQNLAIKMNIEPKLVMRLDEDILKAMYKVEIMEKTLKNLPGLDCGSCGSPNCKALAEDIVQGLASETDCTFKLRQRVRDLAREMVDLAEKLPPSLDKEGTE